MIDSESQSSASSSTQSTQEKPLGRAPLSAKEQKNLFLYVTVGIVLLEFAVTVGAVVYSIANADRLASGAVRFNFPWLGYLVSVALVPAVVMLILHLVSLGFSRTLGTNEESVAAEAVSGRMGKFFALVRGAPAILLFAGFVILGAAIYYLDGVMALLLKLSESFDVVAIWIIGAFAVGFCVTTVARAIFAYKTRQMEAEYAFRREVLERTGTVLLDARHAPITNVQPLEHAVYALEAGYTEVNPEDIPKAQSPRSPLQDGTNTELDEENTIQHTNTANATNTTTKEKHTAENLQL